MISRRKILTLPFTIVASQLMARSAHARRFNDHEKNEADAIAQMKDAQFPNIILVNKANGQLSVIEDGEQRLITPVIIGKPTTPTPNGVFSLQNTANGTMDHLMVFHIDNRVGYFIHGVITGREEAILKKEIRPRQLSDGCINIGQPFLDAVLAFSRLKAKETHLATPIAIMPEAYSSTGFAGMISEFKPEINMIN